MKWDMSPRDIEILNRLKRQRAIDQAIFEEKVGDARDLITGLIVHYRHQDLTDGQVLDAVDLTLQALVMQSGKENCDG